MWKFAIFARWVLKCIRWILEIKLIKWNWLNEIDKNEIDKNEIDKNEIDEMYKMTNRFDKMYLVKCNWKKGIW